MAVSVGGSDAGNAGDNACPCQITDRGTVVDSVGNDLSGLCKLPVFDTICGFETRPVPEFDNSNGKEAVDSISFPCFRSTTERRWVSHVMYRFKLKLPQICRFEGRTTAPASRARFDESSGRSSRSSIVGCRRTPKQEPRRPSETCLSDTARIVMLA